MPDSAVREASFALRVVQRNGGKAAIVYRRYADEAGRDRLQRVGALHPLAYRAAQPMLREAVWDAEGKDGLMPPADDVLTTGAYHSMGTDWGTRIACFAIISKRLRNGERLLRAADQLRQADPDQAAWWFGLLTQEDNDRPLRALRILTEAVE